MEEKICGIILIAFGVFFLRYTIKKPNKMFFSSDVKGYVGSVGAIVLGIMLLFGWI